MMYIRVRGGGVEIEISITQSSVTVTPSRRHPDTILPFSLRQNHSYHCHHHHFSMTLTWPEPSSQKDRDAILREHQVLKRKSTTCACAVEDIFILENVAISNWFSLTTQSPPGVVFKWNLCFMRFHSHIVISAETTDWNHVNQSTFQWDRPKMSQCQSKSFRCVCKVKGILYASNR